MLDRKEVKEGCEYRIDGKPWFVFMVHRPGNGEAVSITSEGYSDRFYQRWQDGLLEMKRMQMRVFQRVAVLPELLKPPLKRWAPIKPRFATPRANAFLTTSLPKTER
jgi:hypothetical protein